MLTNFNDYCKILNEEVLNKARCMIIKENVTSYKKPKVEIVQTEMIDVISTSIIEEDDAPRGPWMDID